MSDDAVTVGGGGGGAFTSDGEYADDVAGKRIKLMEKRVVSMEEFNAARQSLLHEEKLLSKEHDRVRKLQKEAPMLAIEKSYVFDTAGGEKSLIDLFGEKNHLFIYHMMYETAWERPCGICSGWVDSFYSNIRHFEGAGVAVAVVAKADWEKLARAQTDKGWGALQMASSAKNAFNVDFRVEFTQAEVDAKAGVNDGRAPFCTQGHGISMLYREGDQLFLLYQTFRRGVERFNNANFVLDLRLEGRGNWMPRHSY